MAERFQPPPRKKIALDNGKLKLSAPTPGVQGKYAQLAWGLVSNNPRLTVYTGDPEDAGERTGYGKIVAAMDAYAFYMLTGLIKRIALEGPDTKYKMDNMNFTWFGGKRSDGPVVVSSTWVGKDKEGIVWLSVVAKDRPAIKFKFEAPKMHQICRADGSPADAGETSVLAALGYVQLLEGVMANLLVTEYTEPPPPKDRQGGGGGGYNRGGGGGGNSGGGGGQRGGSDAGFAATDDDLPF